MARGNLREAPPLYETKENSNGIMLSGTARTKGLGALERRQIRKKQMRMILSL